MKRSSRISTKACLPWTVLLTLVIAAPLAADDPLQLVGKWGGETRAMDVSGTVMCVAVNDRVQTVNVSAPSAPLDMGQVALPAPIDDLVVVGDYAYVLADGLRVVDLSDPYAPRHVGDYPAASSAKTVTAQGDYVYVARQEGEADIKVEVIDVSVAESPAHKGETWIYGWAEDIHVDGGIVCVADSWNGVHVVDVSDPTAPAERSQYPTSCMANGVVVVGDYVYVCLTGYYCPFGVEVVDISDPDNPAQTGFDVNVPAVCEDIAVSGNYAYLTGYDGVFRVVNVTDPATPSLVGEYYSIYSELSSVAATGTTAYFVEANSRVVLMNVATPASPAPVGWYSTGGMILDVFPSNNAGSGRGGRFIFEYAYVADGEFDVIDVGHSPEVPVWAGGCSTPGGAYGVFANETHAYVADYYNGLQVIDITDVTAPQVVGEHYTGGRATDVVVVGNYAYLADGPAGLRVYDVSTPESPVHLGQYNTPGTALAVTVAGNYAYIADKNKGLQIVDVSSPSAPTWVGAYEEMTQARGVAVLDNYAYVADSNLGLQIIDVTDPTSPTWIGGLDTTYAYGVAVDGQYAYVADLSGGVRMIDVTNPAAPALVFTYPSSDAQNVVLDDTYAYVADGAGGLLLLSTGGMLDADPYINSEDISFDPVSPSEAGTLVTIYGTVHNDDVDASECTLAFYVDGPPDGGGTLIDSVAGLVIPAAGSATTSVNWDTTWYYGTRDIYVVIEDVLSGTGDDPANNTASTAYELADTIPPETVMTVSPEDGQHVPSLDVPFEWTGEDAGAAPEDLLYAYCLATTGGDCDPAAEVFTSEVSTTFLGLDEADNPHVFKVAAKDLADNVDGTPAGRTFWVDVTPPIVTGQTPSDEVVGCVHRVEVVFDAPIAPAGFDVDDVILTGPLGLVPIDSVDALDAPDNTTFAINYDDPLCYDGDYTLAVGPEIEDLAGNSMTEPYDGNFTITDMTPPETTITLGPADGEHFPSLDVTFEWTGTDAGTPTEDLIYSYCLAPASTGCDPTAGPFEADTSATFTGLPEEDNPYEFKVLAKDLSGNDDATPATRTFWVDATAPAVTQHSPSGEVPACADQLEVVFDESINAGTFGPEDVVLTGPYGALAATDVQPLDSPQNTTFAIEFAEPLCADGDYALSVGPAIEDLAGHAMLAAYEGDFTITDAVPPQVIVTDGPADGAHVNVTSVTFAWTGEDVGTPPEELVYAFCLETASEACDPAEETFVADTTVTYDDLNEADSPYTFKILARDPAGNQGTTPLTTTFVVDLTAPEITGHSPDGEVHDCVGFIEVVFNEEMEPDSFEPADVALTGPGGPIAVTSVQSTDPPNNTTYRIHYGGDVCTDGAYEFAVGPAAADLAGNELTEAYTGGFSIAVADLQVTELAAPLESYNDAAFNVEWTVMNDGLTGAIGPWTDKVWFSADDQLGGDRLVGSYPYSGSLGVGESVERIQVVSVPRSWIPTEGVYYLIVETDTQDQVPEGLYEDNNQAVIDIQMSLRLIPDLTVPSIEVPDEAYFDQLITVRWNVTNSGAGATDTASWSDTVYISLDDEPGGDEWHHAFDNLSALDTGESYSNAIDVRVPRGLVGDYHIILETDSSDHVLEEQEDNNVLAVPISFSVPPLPDLVVPEVQAPDEAFAGTSMPVRWTVTNQGTGATLPDESVWYDAVYLSEDGTLDSQDWQLATFVHDTVLDEGVSYIPDVYVPVPEEAVGDHFVLVMTDRRDDVYEHTHEGNNIGYDAVPVHIWPTAPDLVVSAFSAPESAQADELIQVRWTVWNQGLYAAEDTWNDAVYLAAGPVPDPATDTRLATVHYPDDLEAGFVYDRVINVRIPDCIGGTYYLYVRTDSGGQIFEYDPLYDAEANNVSTVLTLEIEDYLLTTPDLAVTALTNDAVGVRGQPLTVSWTVTNTGQGAIGEETWRDRVYLSGSGGGYGSVASRDFAWTGPLGAGESYDREETITVPPDAYGQYHVFVRTDYEDDFNECEGEDNNQAAGAIPVVVDIDLPDVQVQSVSAPSAVVAGSPISVSWVGLNGGVATTGGGMWRDVVYLSSNDSYGWGDKELGAEVIVGPVSPDETYAAAVDATAPIVPQGDYYLLVYADKDDDLFEGPYEDNNYLAIPIEILAPDVDLEVTTVEVGTHGWAGQHITVNWTVTNLGGEAATGVSWYDSVYLSRDQVRDSTDTALKHVLVNQTVPSLGSYDRTVDVVLPSSVSGPYYIFVHTDRSGSVVEPNEDNNVGFDPVPVTVELPPPSDLVTTSVTPPAALDLAPGSPAMTTWTVQNQGDNVAYGTWSDTVYLSEDQTWDIDDTLLGSVVHDEWVGVGQSYTGELWAYAPSVEPGDYYVIVRTDIRNNVRESDETNNLAAAAAVTTVDVTELTLGTPFSSALNTNAQHFFKVYLSEGETLSVRLDGHHVDNANELYVRYGEMVSRSAYDYLFDEPYEEDQLILVSSTKEGWYYILARCDYSAAGPTAYDLTADTIPYSIVSVHPTQGGNVGQVTLRIDGAKFDQLVEVQLIGEGEVLESIWSEVRSQSRVVATFDLADATPGVYDVRVSSEWGYVDVVWEPEVDLVWTPTTLGEYIYEDAFEIVEGGGPVLTGQLSLPSAVRSGTVFPFLVEVANEGNIDLTVPVLLVQSPNGVPISTTAWIRSSARPQTQIVVVGQHRPDVLAPGERAVVPLYSRAVGIPASRFVLQDMSQPGEPLDWESMEPYYRLGGPQEDWLTTWENLQAITGSYWDELHAAMRKAAADRAWSEHEQYYTGTELMLDLLARADSGQLGDDSFSYWHDSGRSYGQEFLEIANSPRGDHALRVLADETHPCDKDLSGAVTTALETSLRTHPDLGILLMLKLYGAGPYMMWVDYLNCGDFNLGEPRRHGETLQRTFIQGAFCNEPDWGVFSHGACEIINGAWSLGGIFFPARYAKGFRESFYTLNVQTKYMKQATGALSSLAGEGGPYDVCNFPANEPKYVDLIGLLYAADKITMEDLTDDGRIPLNMNFGLLEEIPGNLAGGTGSGDDFPDWRRLDGGVMVTKVTNDCGEVLDIQVKSEMWLEVQDTVDFCPGDLSAAGLERILTVPLATLESAHQGEAFDVKFNAIFQPKPLQTESLGAINCCDEEDDCDNPPEPPICSCGQLDMPEDEDPCETGDNIPPECTDECDDPDEDDPDGPNKIDEGSVTTVTAKDPNEKIGPACFGPEGFVSAAEALNYTIYFENVPEAGAWAREVTITDQLDPNLDWRTFRLGEIAFGPEVIEVPQNRSFYQDRVGPGGDYGDLLVDITANVNIATGEARWVLSAIDPDTGEPPVSPDEGLLPPNDPDTHSGEGHVTFTIRGQAGLTTGDRVTNNAEIVFDTEAPLVTNDVVNTLDVAPPTSAVDTLAAQSGPGDVALTWSGEDDVGGSGVASFGIYARATGGTYQVVIPAAINTAGVMHGARGGNTYDFYSIATDNTGNVETAPAQADATTTIPVQVPVAGAFGGPTAATVQVLNLGIANADHAEHAIFEETTGQYVGTNGRLGADPAWLPLSQWADFTVRALSAETTYTFRSKARSVPGEETTLGPATIVTTGLPGDVDGDGDVSQTDEDLVRLCMGTTYGDPAFDPRADLNGDDRVTFADLGLVRVHMYTYGDFDDDGDVDLVDHVAFRGCMTGPVRGLVGAQCGLGDFDRNGDVDLADFAAFQQAFSGGR